MDSVERAKQLHPRETHSDSEVVSNKRTASMTTSQKVDEHATTVIGQQPNPTPKSLWFDSKWLFEQTQRLLQPQLSNAKLKDLQEAKQMAQVATPEEKTQILSQAIQDYGKYKSVAEYRAFWELCDECQPCTPSHRLDKFSLTDLGEALLDHLRTEKDLMETTALLRILFSLCRSGSMDLLFDSEDEHHPEKISFMCISYFLSHSGAIQKDLDYSDVLFNLCLAMLQTEFECDLYTLIDEVLAKDKLLLKDYRTCRSQFQLLGFNNSRFLALGRLCSVLNNQKVDMQTAQSLLLQFFEHFDLESFDSKYDCDRFALQDLLLGLTKLKKKIVPNKTLAEATTKFIEKNRLILSKAKYAAFLELQK
ncbi:MAG: hypothetical protein LLG04_10510 [Parachlamydia sp.]|nr:hypothetical protein [Parachlamydia sp.]